MTRQAIGGFFELELSASGAFPHHGAHRYRSARTAFAALLACRRPARVWMPRYICDAMMEPLIAANIPFSWYHLTDQLDIARNMHLAEDEILLYVNYFGIADQHIDGILADFGADNVVLDFSQAFFSQPRKCLATIYSARKFVGVPDGGFLYASIPACHPRFASQADTEDLQHLIGRMIEGPEPHYHAFTRHEATFTNLDARALSGISERILRSINWEHTAARRAANFAALHDLLGETNGLPVRVGQDAAPLCYPYLHPRASELRRTLAEHRVYTPLFWSEVLGRSAAGSIEERLTNQLLAVPCDQRYGISEMQYIASLIESFE